MKVMRILFLLPLVGTLSGCMLAVGAAAGGTTALYVRGAAEKSYPYSVERVHDAVVASLEDADVVVTGRQVGAAAGRVTGTAPDGKRVTVDLEAVGDDVTRIRLRVGTLGDRRRSEYLVAKIDERL